jgi:hypothetical protein
MATLQRFARVVLYVPEWVRCRLLRVIRSIRGQPPPLDCWLSEHPNVAASVKWQFTFQTNAYDIPDTAKRPWPNWSDAEKQELVVAFEAAWTWLYQQATPYTNLNEALAYPPVNQNDTSNDTGDPWVAVTESYARELYLRWIGLNLAVEIGGHVPWSVTGYTAEQLQILFDSASFLSRRGDSTYNVCGGNPGHPNYVHRKDNLGGSLIAPPRYTLAFLRNANLVSATRATTITSLLNWCRDNLVHFYDAPTYGVMEQHWQYRGIPPITRVLDGTTSTYPNATTFEHWTAGCHGTTGLLRNVLRAVNIPVQILRVCEHGQASFLTEGTYLDHGDNPYNSDFKATGLSAADLLIDQATYTAWFGTTLDNHSTPAACPNIGRQVTELSTS